MQTDLLLGVLAVGDLVAPLDLDQVVRAGVKPGELEDLLSGQLVLAGFDCLAVDRKADGVGRALVVLGGCSRRSPCSVHFS